MYERKKEKLDLKLKAKKKRNEPVVMLMTPEPVMQRKIQEEEENRYKMPYEPKRKIGKGLNLSLVKGMTHQNQFGDRLNPNIKNILII